MDPLPEFPDKYKFAELIGAVPGLLLLKGFGSPEIVRVSGAFEANFNRIQSLILYSPSVARSIQITQRITTKVNLAIAGEVEISIDELASRGLLKPWNEMAEGRAREEMERLKDSTAQVQELVHAMSVLNRMTASVPEGHPLLLAIGSILTTVLVDTWTTFESLSNDLWVAAVNAHPKELASLNGKAKRITRLAEINRKKEFGKIEAEKGVQPANSQDAQSADRHIKLSDIQKFTRQTFDLSNMMGTLLRETEVVGFSRLEAIRRAYAIAFARDCPEIDAALAEPALDRLSAVRNLIVHQNGAADDEYILEQGFIHGLPSLSKAQKIQLDGEIVGRLIKPIWDLSIRLLTAVDEWLKIY